MAPASPAAGPPLRRPRAVAGPQGPWHTVHDDLAATGVVLVYGRLAQWLPHIQDGPWCGPCSAATGTATRR